MGVRIWICMCMDANGWRASNQDWQTSSQEDFSEQALWPLGLARWRRGAVSQFAMVARQLLRWGSWTLRSTSTRGERNNTRQYYISIYIYIYIYIYICILRNNNMMMLDINSWREQYESGRRCLVVVSYPSVIDYNNSHNDNYT